MEDEKTIVLDFDTLNRELKQEEKIVEVKEVEVEEVDIEFLFEIDQTKTGVNALPENPIYLFSYKAKFFIKHSKVLSKIDHVKFLASLQELNDLLTVNEAPTIVFYYNDNPQIVNQLMLQIKSSFPNTKTLIIASNLSHAKAKVHQESKYGANAYLNAPFTIQKFKETINQF
jgi:hypothetical protein